MNIKRFNICVFNRWGKLLRFLISYPKRLFNGVSFRAIVVDSSIHKSAKIQSQCNIRYSTIDKKTYIGKGTGLIYSNVGKFCSIAGNCSIGGGAHKISSISTSPLFFKGRNIFGHNYAYEEFNPYKTTQIGNDVWIGNRAIVLQGLSIGDGAVIGAGSVVTKDVPPYAIVAGNPAKLIRYRFDEDTIKKLLAMKWWDWDEKKLKEYGKLFNNPQALIHSL